MMEILRLVLIIPLIVGANVWISTGSFNAGVAALVIAQTLGEIALKIGHCK